MEILTSTRKALKASCRFMSIAVLSTLLLMAGTLAARASSQDTIEAAYVYNFAKLVSWPESSGPLTIGVIGSSAAGDAIASIVNGKSANGRTITVKSISAGEAKSCQIVFVCGGGGTPSTGGAAVLTVGEASGFAAGGGCIDFIREGGAVHFEVNLGAIKHAHLTPDAKLSQLGKVVG
jgi:hypothetical protein